MTAEHPHSLAPDHHLDEVVAAYLKDLEAGRSPDRQALLARLPQAAEDLAEFFAGLDRMEQFAAPLRAVRQPSPRSSPRAAPPDAAVETMDHPFRPGPRAVIGPARFTILRPYANGGLGQVSVAHDGQLQREVALKEILPDKRENFEARQRFLAEAEITGLLGHPGIVPMSALQVGADGYPYSAMRFIQGRDLSEAIEEHHRRPTPLGFRELLKRFGDVCQTIAYAHSKGVIHRDLKPRNVRLGDYGETLVVDWGLAKRVATGREDTLTECSTPADSTDPAPAAPGNLTKTGQILGTPAYMSPEAAGPPAMVGPASDVYSLGATLYTLLTGRAPFAGEPGEVLRKVRDGDFLRPRRVNPGVPRALEAVCLKAMAQAPSSRHPR